MIALIQRVSYAKVDVADETIGAIDRGLLALLCVVQGDEESQAERLAERLIRYRVFADADDKMNLSVSDIGGEVLLVPQFTLAANTQKGNRPSFGPAAPPDTAQPLFDKLVAKIRALNVPVATGRFGADMKVTLCNEGPVTFWLEAR